MFAFALLAAKRPWLDEHVTRRKRLEFRSVGKMPDGSLMHLVRRTRWIVKARAKFNGSHDESTRNHFSLFFEDPGEVGAIDGAATRRRVTTRSLRRSAHASSALENCWSVSWAADAGSL